MQVLLSYQAKAICSTLQTKHLERLILLGFSKLHNLTTIDFKPHKYIYVYYIML